MGGKKQNTSEGRQGSKRKGVKEQKTKSVVDNYKTPKSVKAQQPFQQSFNLSPSLKQKTISRLGKNREKKGVRRKDSMSDSQKSSKEKSRTPNSNKDSNKSKSPKEQYISKKKEPKGEKTQKITNQTQTISAERLIQRQLKKTPQKTEKNSQTKNQKQKKSNKKQPMIPIQPLKVEEVPQPIQQTFSRQSHYSPQQDENDSNQLQRGISPGTYQPKDSSQNLKHNHSDSRSFGNSRD